MCGQNRTAKSGFFKGDPSTVIECHNLLILFLSSAFWGPPSPTHCGRHIWKPPYHMAGAATYVCTCEKNEKNFLLENE